MNNWQIDFFSALGRVNCMQDTMQITQRATRDLGFDYCGWFARLSAFPDNTRMFVTSNAHDDIQHKVQSGYFQKAPIFQHCAQSKDPVTWQGRTDEPLFIQAPHYWEEYYGYGRRGGWAQSLNDRRGDTSMFVTASTHQLTPAYLNAADTHLRWVAAAIHSNIFRIRKNSTITLTLREREILQWLSDNKPLACIADHMGISLLTAQQHLQHAMFKLESPNPTAAVVKAHFLNLLFVV